MWRLDVSSEAELDIFEAALRYERDRADLGFHFEAEVHSLFARVLENPFRFPEIAECARRTLVRDFPYGVFFTVKDGLVTVLAVVHLHRHLDTWKPRRGDSV
jgi:hypothetical protein